MTTAMLLGCDLKDAAVEEDGMRPMWFFRTVEGKQSNLYRNPITAYDMWLSQVGVYISPQGEVHLPPNLKEII